MLPIDYLVLVDLIPSSFLVYIFGFFGLDRARYN